MMVLTTKVKPINQIHVIISFMGRLPKNTLTPINPEQEKVGENIAKLRKTRGLTQVALAKKTGLSRSAIADYERGRSRIYDVMIIRLANALDVTTDDILCFDSRNAVDVTPDLRIMKRIKKIRDLSVAQQKALLKNIDMFLIAAEKSKQEK